MDNWWDSEMGFWWNIHHIWGKLTHPFRELFWWIVKSSQYAWFLRKDFDWDYSYILYLLQYKLKRTRKQILENNIILRADEVAAQIKHADELIQNWRDDNFCQELYDAHDKKWGKMIDRSKAIAHDEKGKPTLWDWDLRRENSTTEELHEQERKEYMEIHHKAEAEKERNFDELFSHIRKHIQEWWD